jgi:glycosyltransferase involved in cell wall biosynthesis
MIIMNPPLISIITPVFNSAETIEKTILSVLNQEYKEIEHVFIDGLSTDTTPSIIQSYKNQYKHFRFISEKDNGIYDAMNKGLDLCTGDWIYFLGADDEFYHEHVLMELFEQGWFSNEQVVYGNVLIRGGVAWAEDNSVYDGPFNLEKLFTKNICHQSIFYPRSVIKEIGHYSDKYAVTADWDYNVHCFAKYKFAYTDKIISVFKGGGRSSGGGDRSFYEDMPGKVIEYFQLDPSDKALHEPGSPFNHLMDRYRGVKEIEKNGVTMNLSSKHE